MELNARSKQIRRDTIALSKANGGYHYGGCFSCVEILIALYDKAMGSRDKFVMSKGHACWPWYVILRELDHDPKLMGHPSRDPHNGVHCTTGSLGHGLPLAIGMAMAKKIKGEPGKVFVLMGDGECQEGTTWESILIAGKQGLDNLVVIVDWNNIQGSGFVGEILPINALVNVAEHVGFIAEMCNGHSVADLVDIFGWATDLPLIVFAKTIKGRGVSYMENVPKWHACWPNPAQEAKALEELA